MGSQCVGIQWMCALDFIHTQIGSLVQLGVYTHVGPMALPPLSLLLTLRDLTSSSLLAPLAHVDPGRCHALFPVWCDCAEEGGL